LVLTLLWKFYLFSISSFIFNLLNIIFSNLVLILLISIFFPYFFCISFISFQFHPSIQIDGIIFFNSVLIVLIFNFFLGPFVKVIILFNFTIQSKHCFKFLCQFWSSFFWKKFILFFLYWFFFSISLFNKKIISILILIF